MTDVEKKLQFKDEEVGAPSREDRPTGSTHFGDVDFSEEKTEEIGDASWGEVCRTCCIHTPQEWGFILLGITMVLFFLYFFLVGLSLLGTSAKVMGGCTAGALFGDDTNPVAGLMVGILCTVLVQSSSSTTSIIVSLVGAGSVTVKSGIFMVMGANIGTSVTNTIVAMGHLGDGDELERAFAGATVHDMFNFLSVGVLFPIELVTSYLYALSSACVPKTREGQGEKWEGPVKKLVSPLTNLIIKANKDVTKIVAKGKGNCDAGGVFYPVKCTVGEEISYKSCVPPKGGCEEGVDCPQVGLITCDKEAGCPAFFQDGASKSDDVTSGAVCFFLALVILIGCLIGLVTMLQKMLMGVSTRIIYKATNINGYLAMLVGCGITVLVQSSSITTSALTPFVGMGALRIEQMFPITLGANIGTTFTGLLASLVSEGTDSLQVALCHLFFNISGILIWYPIPFMRRIPLRMAKALGKATRIWRGFPILYIIVVFIMIPVILLGLSSLFQRDSLGFTVLGAVLCVSIFLLIFWFIFAWFKGGLRVSIVTTFENRQRRMNTQKTLPDDIDSIKAELARLREHTGLLEDEVESEKFVEAESKSEDRQRRMNTQKTLPDDIDSIKTELARLREHIGLLEDEEESDKDVEEKSDKDVESEATTRILRGFYFLFIIVIFIVIPVILFGISFLFQQDSKGFTVLGAFLCVSIFLLIFWFIFAWFKGGLRVSIVTTFENRQRRMNTQKSLPDDIDSIKAELARLREHTGLLEDEVESDKDVEAKA